MKQGKNNFNLLKLVKLKMLIKLSIKLISILLKFFDKHYSSENYYNGKM